MIATRLSDDQRHLTKKTCEIYRQFLSAGQRGNRYHGGMHWKKAKGRQYLFRSLDRFGYGKSLGPRTPETERMLADFRRSKSQSKTELSTIRAELASMAASCKTAGIHRIPRVMARVIRYVTRHQLLEESGLILGTASLYAYEAEAGVFLDDRLLSARKPPPLTFCFPEIVDKNGFLNILRKADRSFAMIHTRGRSAVNKTGFKVEWIKRKAARSYSEIPWPPTIDWLIQANRFARVVIDEDGHPAQMVVPDPRVFAVHHLWLSQQPSRPAAGRAMDRLQGRAAARLIVQYLPGYRFTLSELRRLPMDVLEECKAWASRL